jgi:hypothetical protein
MIFVGFLHLTMNKTSNLSPFSVFGAFASSGFFTKALTGKRVSAVAVRAGYYQAATPTQAARLSGYLGRRTASHPRF